MPSGAAGACVIAKLFRLVAAELRERAVDKARLENVLGRRRDRQIAELPTHFDLPAEFARMSRLCRVGHPMEQRAFGKSELGAVVTAREQVAVTVRRDLDRGVAQSCLHDLQRKLEAAIGPAIDAPRGVEV